ncbi:Sec-independent protein translocase protein TatB [Psychrosphaera aestuarii]|uniref:Sec-independent protein translocase protein TatB n=1 Tax=Psychrosphaera aestuarii TaxID=1266052 RepID=UPI001B32BF5B|nr:Sec-independent protein translocase protein TatB [Psychrosphaera aestuarii]
MGFWEFIVIAIVGTIVLGPDKLPGALRKLVEMKRKLSQMTQGLSAEVNEQLRIHELHQNLKEAEKSGLTGLSPELQNSVDELKAAAKSVNPNFIDESASVAEDNDKQIINKPNDPVTNTNEPKA